MGSQKGTQMEAKMVQKSIRSSPRAPLGLLWELLGSLFGTVFSTLFLNVEMVAKIMPNGIPRIEGLPLSAYPPSPSRTLPLLQLSLKGTLEYLQRLVDAFRNI